MFHDDKVPVFLKIANTMGLLLVLVVNALANILPINGLGTGEVSDLYPNLFAPAGITFSIWGVIYFFLILYVSYQYRFVRKKTDKKIVELIGWYFFASCLLNAGWIVLWHYLLIEWSMVVMVALLVVLMRIFHLVHWNTFADSVNHWFVRIPFSIYAGWTTVATIANATALLVHLQWSGWGVSQQIWTLIMMVVATALMGFVVWRYKNPTYGLVLIWTLFGIWWKHKQVYEMEYPWIFYGALILMAVMAVLIFLSYRGKEKGKHRLY